MGEGGSRLRLTDEESDFEETKIVRTKISNCKRLFVHFFDTRQRNEPKKTRVRALPLRIPWWSRATHKNTSCFCSDARGCCIAEALLSPFQKNGEKWGYLYGMNIKFGGGDCFACVAHGRSFQRKTNYKLHLWGEGPMGALQLAPIS